jgi:hypothetical protein
MVDKELTQLGSALPPFVELLIGGQLLMKETGREAYREALAEKLGVSRGHVSRLVSQARRADSPGLGPMRAARSKKGDTTR